MCEIITHIVPKKVTNNAKYPNSSNVIHISNMDAKQFDTANIITNTQNIISFISFVLVVNGWLN